MCIAETQPSSGPVDDATIHRGLVRRSSLSVARALTACAAIRPSRVVGCRVASRCGALGAPSSAVQVAAARTNIVGPDSLIRALRSRKRSSDRRASPRARGRGRARAPDAWGSAPLEGSHPPDRRPTVGGMTPSRTAAAAARTSVAPPAPTIQPVAPMSEATGIEGSKHSAMAEASAKSWVIIAGASVCTKPIAELSTRALCRAPRIASTGARPWGPSCWASAVPHTSRNASACRSSSRSATPSPRLVPARATDIGRAASVDSNRRAAKERPRHRRLRTDPSGEDGVGQPRTDQTVRRSDRSETRCPFRRHAVGRAAQRQSIPGEQQRSLGAEGVHGVQIGLGILGRRQPVLLGSVDAEHDPDAMRSPAAPRHTATASETSASAAASNRAARPS